MSPPERAPPTPAEWDAVSSCLSRASERSGRALLLGSTPRRLAAWRALVPSPVLHHLTPQAADGDGVVGHRGDPTSAHDLDRLALEMAGETFDLIVDDGPLTPHSTSLALLGLFPRQLREGGVYVVTDWLHGTPTPARPFVWAGMPPSRSRSPSDTRGVGGFLKGLIDHVAANAGVGPDGARPDVFLPIRSLAFEGRLAVLSRW